MGSRDKDHATPHQPLLSSLVVRPTDSGGGGGGGGAGSDYEPGEVRRDPPPYFRSDRQDDRGYRMRAGSVSPVRNRDERHRFSPGFERSGGAPRGRGFGRGRGPARHRDYSPPYGRGRFAGRFGGKGYDRFTHGPGPLRVDGLPRNNPNVQPRDGDWICKDPSCKNLNFARREHCNNCNRSRYAPSGSPRRGYRDPPFPPRHPPLDHSPPGRIMNGNHRSPPRVWPRDGPRAPVGPPLRHNRRFPDPPPRGNRQDFPEDESRDRFRYDRPVHQDWGHRDRGRDNHFNNRRGGYGRRSLSPPPGQVAAPSRDWARERSRSPVRGGPPAPAPAPPKDYQRDVYMNRGQGRDERRGVVGRDSF
ncbi:hypothetical protein ACJIZ3_024479 [Penstemon smallii]|uniref:RanBP2-type domain-containing protein n=1 Tax=Penstemon smallii TaxID=265156 RepID=A0ABD3TU10_9LAMI